MLGKTGLILFIPSDFSSVHEVEISKAIYKLNTCTRFIDIKILQATTQLLTSSLRHDRPELTNKYHFYNEVQH